MDPVRWKQIESLYHAAMDRDARERAAFLAEACGDAQLRHEVETLLQQDGSLLDRPAWDRMDPVPGTRLGRYQVLAKIGEGSTTAVYSVRDERLGRTVALKLLSREIEGDAARRRFQQAAKTLSSLHHPHILTVHEAGETGAPPVSGDGVRGRRGAAQLGEREST